MFIIFINIFKLLLSVLANIFFHWQNLIGDTRQLVKLMIIYPLSGGNLDIYGLCSVWDFNVVSVASLINPLKFGSQ